MVYSNDQWIQLPTKDIYDTNMMLAAVQAAKDMYEKGVKQLEDFNKTYGDFYSPISKDMEWYNQNVTGKVRDTINDLYAQGIDPIRSAEGRAILQRLIYNMPVGEINQRKQSAETATQFNAAKQKAIANGTYSQDMEDILANGMNPDNWDTGIMGVFNRPSPYTYQTLHDFTAPLVDDTKASPLTPQQVRDLNYAPKSGYDYTGITEDMQRRAIRDAVPGLYGSPIYQYYRKVAENKLRRKGIDPTQEQIDTQLERDMLTSVPEYIGVRDEKVNPLYLDSARTSNDIRAHIAKAEYDRAHPDAKEQKALLELEDYKDATGRNGKAGVDRAKAKAKQDADIAKEGDYSYVRSLFDQGAYNRTSAQRKAGQPLRPIAAQTKSLTSVFKGMKSVGKKATLYDYTKALTSKDNSGEFINLLHRQAFEQKGGKSQNSGYSFYYNPHEDAGRLVTAAEMLSHVAYGNEGQSFIKPQFSTKDEDAVYYDQNTKISPHNKIVSFVDTDGYERLYKPVTVMYPKPDGKDGDYVRVLRYYNYDLYRDPSTNKWDMERSGTMLYNDQIVTQDIATRKTNATTLNQ